MTNSVGINHSEVQRYSGVSEASLLNVMVVFLI